MQIKNIMDGIIRNSLSELLPMTKGGEWHKYG